MTTTTPSRPDSFEWKKWMEEARERMFSPLFPLEENLDELAKKDVEKWFPTN